MSKYDEHLGKLNEAADFANLSAEWEDYLNKLNPRKEQEIFAELKHEFEQDKEKWIEELYDQWIQLPNAIIKSLEIARLAAIRTLGRIAGQEADTSELAFDKLCSVIQDEQQSDDARAWALYTLHWCHLQADKDRWDLFLWPKGKHILHETKEAKVREYVLYAIREMVRSAAQSDQNENLKTRFRLHESLFQDAENVIVTQWYREIDRDVKERLIESLGEVAGHHAHVPRHNWGVIDVLKQADPEDAVPMLAYKVPEALKSIAHNLLNNQNIDDSVKKLQIEKLIGLAATRLAQTRRREGRAVGRYYNIKRAYLLAIEDVAKRFLRRSTEPNDDFEEIAKVGLDAILGILKNGDFEKDVQIRTRTLHIISDLAKSHKEANHSTRFVSESVGEKLKLMVGDPERSVAEDVTDVLVSLFGEEETAKFYVELILDNSGKDLEAIRKNRIDVWQSDSLEGFSSIVRERAARALATIPRNNAAHNQLVEALRADGAMAGEARRALEVMGGGQAVEALLEARLQKQMNEQFFKPMAKARQKNYEMLDQVTQDHRSAFDFTWWMAVATSVVGVVLIALMVFSFWNGEAEEGDIFQAGGLIAGFVMTVSGLVISFFWDPAKGLNKAAAEMTRNIIGTEGYLARNRLIGLGFAHAYTQNKWENLRFLKSVSEATGSAMQDSALLLSDIGEWPTQAGTTVKVPNLVGRSVKEVNRLIEESQLQVLIKKLTYHGTVAEQHIIEQMPNADIQVALGTKVEVVVSAGKAPEANDDPPSTNGTNEGAEGNDNQET